MSTFKRDGVQLHYELEGSGSPAVLICGSGSHSNDAINSALRPALAQHHTVLTVDNRGAGQTVVGEDASFTIEDMADDIAAIIDHHQLGAVHTLGISMGGAIAMMLALRYPERICSEVVAVSMAQGEVLKRSRFMLDTLRVLVDGQVPMEIVNRFATIILLGESAFDNPAVIDAWVHAPADPFMQTSAGYLQQTKAVEHFEISARLPSITTPTLVIGSPEDILVPLRFQEELAGAIPNAEFKRYPGGHTFMLLPENYGAFVSDVEAFWGKYS